jgi:hypothetical protein
VWKQAAKLLCGALVLSHFVQRHPVTPKPKLGSNGYAQIIAVSVVLIVPNIRAIRVRLAQVVYPLWDCSTTFLALVPRDVGFTIDTEREEHDGDYPGFHARYRLCSTVILGHLHVEAAQ